jgi:hypothetical protein
VDASDWKVVATTDDGRTLHLSINRDTRQLFLAVSSSQRAPEHVATFNGKTKSLDNLVDSLIEGLDQLDALGGALAVANETAPGDGAHYVGDRP